MCCAKFHVRAKNANSVYISQTSFKCLLAVSLGKVATPPLIQHSCISGFCTSNTECTVNLFNVSGTPNGCIPRLNILHLQNGVYTRTIGRMMSTIIVQGGEPPAFLSLSVVDYIVYGDILQLKATPDDIGDPDLRENLNKVMCNFLI